MTAMTSIENSIWTVPFPHTKHHDEWLKVALKPNISNTTDLDRTNDFTSHTASTHKPPMAAISKRSQFLTLWLWQSSCLTWFVSEDTS